jgi:hypothetical protein
LKERSCLYDESVQAFRTQTQQFIWSRNEHFDFERVIGDAFRQKRVGRTPVFSFKRRGGPIGWMEREGTPLKDNQSSLAGGVNRFQSTRWSMVLVSAQSQAPGYQEALADLCKLYWFPLYAFVRHRGYSSEDGQDLVQGFFLHLIEYKTLSRVDRSKGKFRSFLLASLQNFLANEADPARCLKRGGKAGLEVSVGSLKTQIHRLRKQYAATIREEISRTLSDPADLETETHELCEALIAAEGWVML